MKQRSLCVPLSVLLSVGANAQTVELSNGNMTVQEGTTLSLNGPLVLLVQNDANLINNGVIDLGDATVLFEAAGNPIRGTGIEVSRLQGADPLSAAVPGGLGLVMSTTVAPGPTTVTRGHSSAAFPEGDLSIARWFSVDALSTTGVPMELELRYDATELGLLEPNALVLFRAPALDGPWTALPSTNDPAGLSVSGGWESPWTFVTAFDANAPTASPTLFANAQVSVWPTLTTGQVFVQSTDGSALGSLEVLDATGRQVLSPVDGRTSTFATLDLFDVAAGSYFLRIGQRTTIKLRKE